ncbi:MAG: undecaprenyl-diphosphatase [Burkholderiales bacterium]|nr:undecaprenyl-diphosphatase [Burkholderiales bacterium]MDE2626852.1 undecaprenyl-diphosphatase [Burkholderiales bacterium]
MDNLHLFELINAAPGLGPVRLLLATVLAQWLIWLVPIAMAFAWVRGDLVARAELLHMLLAALIALGVAQIVVHVWPQPRPFALHLGTQYLQHSTDPGLPSDHVTVFWSLALGALASRRYAVWGFPLLATGLVVGWARVYLGVHFPFDVLAAFPVAVAGVLIARGLQGPLSPVAARVIELYDRCIAQLRSRSARRNA